MFVGLGAAYVTSDSGNLFSSGRGVTVTDFTLDEARLKKGAGTSMVIPIKTTGTIVSETSKIVTMVDIDVTIYSCAKGNAETLEGCEVAVEARISPAGRIQPNELRSFESTIYFRPRTFRLRRRSVGRTRCSGCTSANDHTLSMTFEGKDDS